MGSNKQTDVDQTVTWRKADITCLAWTENMISHGPRWSTLQLQVWGSPALILFLRELHGTSDIFWYAICEAKCVVMHRISVIHHLIKMLCRMASFGLMTRKVKPAAVTWRSLSLITWGTLLNAYCLWHMLADVTMMIRCGLLPFFVEINGRNNLLE
jgi:hypothetical protein